MINDTQLDALLSQHEAPEPRADLSADILAAAAKTPQIPAIANDRVPVWKRYAPRFAGLAACLIAVGFAGTQLLNSTQSSEAEQWELVAENTGFIELHEWVYAEES